MRFFQKYFFLLFLATFRREPQTHFTFFSPSLFPFVQSNSFVMRQFPFPLYAPAFIRAKNALILSHLNARCRLIRSQFLVSVRKKMPCGSFAHPLRARRQPPRLATGHFSFFHDFMGQLWNLFDKVCIFFRKLLEMMRMSVILSFRSGEA